MDAPQHIRHWTNIREQALAPEVRSGFDFF